MAQPSFTEWYAYPQLHKYRLPFKVGGQSITFHLPHDGIAVSFTVPIGEVERDPVTGLWCAALPDGYSVYDESVAMCLIGVVDISVSYETDYGGA